MKGLQLSELPVMVIERAEIYIAYQNVDRSFLQGCCFLSLNFDISAFNLVGEARDQLR